MNPSLDSRHRPHSAWLVASLILSCGILPTSSFAQGTAAPQLIPFQGRLTNQANIPYDNGQYTITLNLYSLAIGGSTVWTERHEKVSVIAGMLNLFLGSISRFDKGTPNLADDVDFSTTKYLGITVDADNNPATADPEMVPRTMIVNAFHAQNASNLAGHNWSAILQGGSNNPQTGFIRADKLNPASITNSQIAPLTINTASIANNSITTGKLAAGAVDSSSLADNSILAADLAAAVRESLVPPGTILPFGGSLAPAGFLMCDGAAYSRTGTYLTLFTAISTNFGAPNGTSFNVPDLRGQFLRGVDSSPFNRDLDKASRTPMAAGGAAGATVGSVQTDGVGNHYHRVPGVKGAGGAPTVIGDTAGNFGTEGTGAADISGDISGNWPQSKTSSVSNSIGIETRPKNAYVNYIIKY